MSLKRLRQIAVDILLLVFAIPAGLILRRARRGWRHLPLTRRALKWVGVFPLRHHYYEPVVYAEDLQVPLDQERTLAGLDLNVSEQLTQLARFHFNDELRALPLDDAETGQFFYRNGSFEPGDAEYLYNVIRDRKPRRVLEVGSGHSTRMARHAIIRNRAEDPTYTCIHTCIEPYEHPLLERTGAVVIRERVERCDPALFDTLECDDVLFIDSSHVIRPQGDVVFEYLEVLGRLQPGVWVHVHDIFTPRDYPATWVLDDQKLWDEQYLLEAFLVFNRDFRVVGALNHLYHHHYNALTAVCPVLAESPAGEPRSFWMVRNHPNGHVDRE